MSQPADADTPPATPTPPDELFVIGSDARALHAIAAIAPGLSEPELKVAIHLTKIRDRHHNTALASSREIAEATKVARSNVVRAIDSLNFKCHLSTRQGSGQKASAHRLNFLFITAIASGPTVGPLAQTSLPLQEPQWSYSETTSRDHNPPLDIDTSDSILDRVFTARPNTFQRSALESVRGHAYKWLLLQRGMQHAQPPDLVMAAQLATAAGGCAAAEDWIRTHLVDKQADNCGYLLSWMIHQLHGINATATRKRRREIHLAAKSSPIGHTPTPDAPADPEFQDSLVQQATARVKTLR